jgi:hypothetical protein
VKLTDTTVRTASLPEGRGDVIFFDDRLKGFGLRLQGASRRYLQSDVRQINKLNQSVDRNQSITPG